MAIDLQQMMWWLTADEDAVEREWQRVLKEMRDRNPLKRRLADLEERVEQLESERG